MSLISYLKPATFCLLPHVGGMAGSFITRANIKNWYDKDLQKPWWRPPNWLFAPVWTTLYTAMGYSSYMIYRDGGGFQGRAAVPLALYGTQLALNWAWTPIFFGAKRIGLAACEITVLTGAVIATMVKFHEISGDAAHILIPYIAWLGLATSLNWWIYLNNPSQDKAIKKD